MPSNGFGLPQGSVPWASDGALFEQLHTRIEFQAAVTGVLHSKKPQPDEILALEGLGAPVVARWCAEGWESDLFRAARRKGFALASGAEAGDADLRPFEQVLAVMLPEAFPEVRSWWLVLARRTGSFSSLEQQEAILLLRQWQVSFDQARDPVVGRLLLGHDNRLIQADPWTRVELLHHPQMLDDLLNQLGPVVKQRYPDLKNGQTRDVALQLAGRPVWICFHHNVLPGVPDSGYWYLELSDLEPDELPAVGSLEDDRISRSLAFIHENFGQAPSLAQTAQAAHVSPFHFHRLFTQAVGISPKQYVQKKQLQVARHLLRSSRTPVGDIASKAGFSSHGHFTSTFHRVVGQSPRDYRESH